MSRYFFALQNGDGPVRDNEGLELAARADIVREVGHILLEIARDETLEQARGTAAIVVRDINGKAVQVAELTFSNLWLDDVAPR
ncbi:MAG TPA: hypothetical protein VL202_09930 [Pararhizobium sp.]|uniref:DUF6894 family protein n=1 Tax=Pararhizobium sp. TaxID=1977563 RepID=UPI002B77AB86|nr:hypothetical protein [Pararhizobium sp.]HTO31479.1 hypothetical protein [Pararhizobium sp.]